MKDVSQSPQASESSLPEADIEGFIDWIENSYTDERWSDVYRRDDSVTVWSGKYPAFSRFQKDLRPRLHEHGLVISETRTRVPKTIDGESETVHWLGAIPMAKAAAKAHGLQCSRHACTDIVENADAEYCESCAAVMEEAGV